MRLLQHGLANNQFAHEIEYGIDSPGVHAQSILCSHRICWVAVVPTCSSGVARRFEVSIRAVGSASPAVVISSIVSSIFSEIGFVSKAFQRWPLFLAGNVPFLPYRFSGWPPTLYCYFRNHCWNAALRALPFGIFIACHSRLKSWLFPLEPASGLAPSTCPTVLSCIHDKLPCGHRHRAKRIDQCGDVIHASFWCAVAS